MTIDRERVVRPTTPARSGGNLRFPGDPPDAAFQIALRVPITDEGFSCPSCRNADRSGCRGIRTKAMDRVERDASGPHARVKPLHERCSLHCRTDTRQSRGDGGFRLRSAGLRTDPPAHPGTCRHPSRRGQAGNGLQPALAAPARARSSLVRVLSALARIFRRAGRQERMAGIRQLPDHQSDLVFPRGTSFRSARRRTGAAPGAAHAHLVQRRLDRRRALFTGDDGDRDARAGRGCEDPLQRHQYEGARRPPNAASIRRTSAG